MGAAWMAPIPIEPLIADPEAFTTNIFALRGDSMILVDRAGRRVVNEKLSYHELATAFLRWDPATATYPNLRPLHGLRRRHAAPLRRRQERQPAAAARAATLPHIVSGDTLEELGARLARRLETASRRRLVRRPARPTASRRRSPRRSRRFDADARAGERPRVRPRPVADRALPERPGPARGTTATPRSTRSSRSGPYHAMILAPGTLDTKGGPAIDAHGRVLSVDGGPIPGLYAAGNCAGFPSGQAYWAGGATIGLAITFGRLAALDAAAR